MKKISTKDIIARTVFELLQKKTIEEITVSEIAREVEISTRTFYNCFQDKYDVTHYLYDQLLDRCWITEGRRSTLNEFFDHLMAAIVGEYSSFFANTTCYTGQSSINEYIVERGVEDLKEQLKYTGHEEFITPERTLMLQFYMRGLMVTLQIFYSASQLTKDAIIQADKTLLLPQDLYAALTTALQNTDTVKAENGA